MPSEYEILTNEGGFLDKFEQAHLDTLSARDDAVNSIAATGGVDYVVTSITERDNLSPSSGEISLVLSGNTGEFYEWDGSAWNQKGPTVRDISLGPTSVSQLSDLRSKSSNSTGELVQVSSDDGGLFVAKASDPFGNGDDSFSALKAKDGEWWARRDMLGGRPNAAYVLSTDGTTINAEPKRPSLDFVNGTSIGSVLEEIIINQLEPVGTDKEAEGALHFQKGEYPGYLSDYANRQGTVLPMGLSLIGEGRQDPVEASTQSGQIPNQEPLVTFYTQDDGFVEPDIDTDAIIGPTVRNIALWGPGTGTAGSVGFNGNSGATNRWDWMELTNVSVWDFDVAHDFRNSHHVKQEYCHWQKFNRAYAVDGQDKFWCYNAQYFSPEDGSRVEVPGGRLVRIVNTFFGTRANSDSGNLYVDTPDNLVCVGNHYNDFGGVVDGAGCYVYRPGQMMSFGGQTENGMECTNAVRVEGGTAKFFGFADQSNADESFQCNGARNLLGQVADFVNCTAKNGAGYYDGFNHPCWNGVQGGGPFKGIDLSSRNGRYEGDRAVAIGETTADKRDLAFWDDKNEIWLVFQHDIQV
jgi:hypothetical protein